MLILGAPDERPGSEPIGAGCPRGTGDRFELVFNPLQCLAHVKYRESSGWTNAGFQ